MWYVRRNMQQHEVPDQTGLLKCRFAGQSPIKEGTPNTEIRDRQRTDFHFFKSWGGDGKKLIELDLNLE